MVFQLSEHLRRAICAAAVLAYVLPAILGALTLVGHTVEHLAEEAQEQRRIATSLGLTHDSDAVQHGETPSDAGVRIDPADPNSVVHTHGGSTHAHNGTVSDLIRINGHVDGSLTTDESATSQIASHVPGNASTASSFEFAKVSSAPVAIVAATDSYTAVWLPPPRA